MTTLITREQMQRNLKNFQITYVLAKCNYDHAKNPTQREKWRCEMHECEEFMRAHKRILASNLLN